MPHAFVHQQPSTHCNSSKIRSVLLLQARYCLLHPPCPRTGAECLQTPISSTRLSARGVKRRCPVATASPSFGDNIKRVAKQVQGALPLVGLLSRLTSPSGGIGRDMLAYPEFCRATFDLAPANFLTVCSELQKHYGQPADRRYVLLYLWMAREGGGVVPSKPIMSSAKRLRVTQDMEIEIDRFEGARSDIAKKYSYMDRPVGKPQDQINIAVDALSRLVTGTPDTAAIPEPAASLLEELVKGAWADIPDAEQLAKAAVTTRPERAEQYK